MIQKRGISGRSRSRLYAYFDNESLPVSNSKNYIERFSRDTFRKFLEFTEYDHS